MSYQLEDFETQVRQLSKQTPVLVDFWAPWCGPCRTLGPLLERMAAQANGRWELVKVNTEEHQQLAVEFNITSIPAVKLFVNGEVKAEFVGALPEREIRQFLDDEIPSASAPQVATAKRLLSEGSNAPAAKLLEPIVEVDPRNAEARVLLAQALMSTDPKRIASELETITPDSEFFDRAAAIRTLARLAQVAKEPTALPEAKVREKYLADAAAVSSMDFEAALEALIEVLERDKHYDNGGVKEACKAIFQLLGARHPLVERSVRAFSSALHA